MLHEGKKIVERNFGVIMPACNTMSATKSVTALAIGLLLDEGKLAMDTPLHKLFPEYVGTLKSKVTVRHLMEHTSGIKSWDKEPPAKLENLNSRVRDALDAPVVTEPGKVFAYNNRATNLLSGVVRKASGQKMDDYLREKLFKPMGIDFYWVRDPAGDPHGCAELYMRPADMAKVGQMVMDQGKWNGKQLLSASFIKDMTTDRGHGASCGWLWWIETKLYGFNKFLMDTLNEKKASTTLTQRLKPLLDRWFDSKEAAAIAIYDQAGTQALKDELVIKGGKDGSPTQTFESLMTIRDDAPAFAAKGWGGQYIVIIPGSKIVAVRTSGDPKAFDDTTFGYDMNDFVGLVRALDPKFNE